MTTDLKDKSVFDVPSMLVENAERIGQRRLVQSTQLPSDGLLGQNRAMWEACGIEIVSPAAGDYLFTEVRLPAGWQKRPTDHHYWSDLVDDAGRKRGVIFFKAVSYDRRAFLRPVTRFAVDRDFERPDADAAIVFQVKDCDTVVFQTDMRPMPDGTGAAFGDALHAIEEELAAQCVAWLEERDFPDYRNPASYWDVSDAPQPARGS